MNARNTKPSLPRYGSFSDVATDNLESQAGNLSPKFSKLRFNKETVSSKIRRIIKGKSRYSIVNLGSNLIRGSLNMTVAAIKVFAGYTPYMQLVKDLKNINHPHKALRHHRGLRLFAALGTGALFFSLSFYNLLPALLHQSILRIVAIPSHAIADWALGMFGLSLGRTVVKQSQRTYHYYRNGTPHPSYADQNNVRAPTLSRRLPDKLFYECLSLVQYLKASLFAFDGMGPLHFDTTESDYQLYRNLRIGFDKGDVMPFYNYLNTQLYACEGLLDQIKHLQRIVEYSIHQQQNQGMYEIRHQDSYALVEPIGLARQHHADAQDWVADCKTIEQNLKHTSNTTYAAQPMAQSCIKRQPSIWQALENSFHACLHQHEDIDYHRSIITLAYLRVKAEYFCDLLQDITSVMHMPALPRL
jgi:hypothetical protein